MPFPFALQHRPRLYIFKTNHLLNTVYRPVLCIEQDLGITKWASRALVRKLDVILLALYVILAAIYELQRDAVYKLAIRCKVTAPERNNICAGT